MKLMKYLLPFAMAAYSFTALFADGSYSTTIEAKERDVDAVRDYINTKRVVSVSEKGGQLKISGDLRTEWSYLHARTKGVKQRGYSTRELYPNTVLKEAADSQKPNKGQSKKQQYLAKVKRRETLDKLKAPIPSSEFEVEANLVFDYIADRSWGTIRLQMSNPAGLSEIDRKAYMNDSRRILYGSGKMSNIALRKAFMGYNVWEEGTSRLDVEIGRRRLYDAFESRIQFHSVFDGVLARFTTSFDGMTDFYAKAAAFVVDSSVNHFGYVGEIGFSNIADSGFNLLYSLIHWDRHAPNRYNKHHPLGVRFINSQVTAEYQVSPDFVRLPTKFYGAYLVNHAARANYWTHHHKANDAFYIGCTVGRVERKGDYAFDVTYQYVEAQAVSERDIPGMCKDNPRAFSFYNRHSGGFGNYKGYKIDAFYAVTDNLTFNAYFQNVNQASRKIGGKHHSNEFSLAAIYAF